MMGGARRGFSMPELLVVVVLGVLLIFALQQTIMSQRRYYGAQRAAAERHETMRISSAVLSSALREVNIPGGDVAILAPDRFRVRMPLGLAAVCGTDAAGQRVGIVNPDGRWVAGAADSVLIQRAGGWSAHAITSLTGPVVQVPCVATGGAVLQLDQNVPDVVVGSGARAFRSQVFEGASDGAIWWLYRQDGAQRDLLTGPLAGAQGLRAWYEDAGGTVLPGPAGAQRVGIRVVARALEPLLYVSNRTDTLELTFTGRNR
ncbi:MAG TPA: prepilin-type N-terminal cleavage/methylation domain-containing protein [Longimicrobiales bacterium]|nr:prepilin-type N-terminal cleavage/methylation domain-containing protein [Longimicrobiales bacterium]